MKLVKSLEEHELLLNVADDLEGLHLEYVESNGLGERSALSDGHNISNLKMHEAWRAMCRYSRMSIY